MGWNFFEKPNEYVDPLSKKSQNSPELDLGTLEETEDEDFVNQHDPKNKWINADEETVADDSVLMPGDDGYEEMKQNEPTLEPWEEEEEDEAYLVAKEVGRYSEYLREKYMEYADEALERQLEIEQAKEVDEPYNKFDEIADEIEFRLQQKKDGDNRYTGRRRMSPDNKKLKERIMEERFPFRSHSQTKENRKTDKNLSEEMLGHKLGRKDRSRLQEKEYAFRQDVPDIIKMNPEGKQQLPDEYAELQRDKRA